MTETVYKICSRGDWKRAAEAGEYTGSEDDRRDGFIHFSTAAQVAESVGKHFAGQDALVLVAVNAAQLGDKLKWEPSRGGGLFPHLYGILPVEAVHSVDPLPLGADGAHRFPEGVAS